MPNATHILQPFDVRIFSPLKDAWAAAVLSWQICNIGDPITKQNFNIILEMAWYNTTSNDNGKATKLAANAFRKTGIYPFDVSKVDQLCTLTGKQNEAKSAYFAMMAKQQRSTQVEGQVAPGTSSTAPTPTRIEGQVVPGTSSSAPTRIEGQVVPGTSSTAPTPT